MWRRMLLFVCIAAGVCLPATGAELFPFVVSYGQRANLTDVSGWLQAPAGRSGFVRSENGHFVTDAGRIRFWATNLCFSACFPDHEQAERLAARLASFGINCVRMHHMDSRDIWGRSPNKLTIDPAQLERLDYLIYQLKQHGIYTNINLHVSRWLGDKEGFPHREKRPKYDKGIGNFEPRMIELQKKYARDLLTHVNPYTGNPYTAEPAIAFVEISNEDALFAVWSRGQLDDLPDPYVTTFRRLWNGWLRQKYGTTEKLARAWNSGRRPLGKEMLRNGSFDEPLQRTWQLQRDDQTELETSVLPGGPKGSKFLRLIVRRQGRESWIPQFSQGGLAVKKEAPYTLSFFARAKQPARIGINCMMDHPPWQRLGLSRNIELGTEWKQFRFTFVATADDADARITVTGLSPGTYDLTGFSFRTGGIVGLEPGQRLEDDTVPVLQHGSLNNTTAARNDWIDFLWDTERDYWWGMYRFLKDQLHLRSLVAGTQLSYSPPHVQAGLDYIDAHSYWQHPAFPGRPWDSNNWYIRNIALVNEPGGTLAGLAVRRVAGMPFSVSEYNHPAPNAYAAEGFPMLAAFAGFQDWDAVYSFTYSHSTDFEPRRISSYFDIKSDPSRLVHMPACAAMFLRGRVDAAKRTVAARLSLETERQLLREALSAWTATAETLGVDKRLSLLHAVAIDLQGRPRGTIPKLNEQMERFVSDTGQLRWDVSEPGAGYFIADTPACKLFTGFVRGRSFDLGGGVRLSVGSTKLDWVTVSVTAIDGHSIGEPGRLLIAATGYQQNTGWQLEELGKNRITLRRRWGTDPVLCEGVPAEITLPVPAQRVRFWALDEAGNRKQTAGVEDREGRALLELSPRFQTLWYEVQIR